jgi:hypothetical protein
MIICQISFLIAYAPVQYFFYPTFALVRVFRDMSPAAAALRAWQIEDELSPYRLDAVTALEQYNAGVEIGHTVFVLANILNCCRAR